MTQLIQTALASSGASRWNEESEEATARESVVQLGVWMFLGTVTMLFAAFTSAYIVRRGSGDWRPMILPSVLWLNTAVLAGSSGILEHGRRQAVRGQWRAAQLSIAAAILLGLGFLGGQLVAWRQLVSEGVYVRTLPHSSFFYMLTGVHAAHLIAGLVVLTLAVARISPARSRSGGLGRVALVKLAATFWHFFGALWIYLFALLTR
jgi:cytochrome c oxidase subunit 3